MNSNAAEKYFSDVATVESCLERARQCLGMQWGELSTNEQLARMVAGWHQLAASAMRSCEPHNYDRVLDNMRADIVALASKEKVNI